MRLVGMPARPHDDNANDDFNDGVRPRHKALRIRCLCCLPRLITAQQFSAPAIELRRQYPDLPRDCRDVHTRLTGLLAASGVSCTTAVTMKVKTTTPRSFPVRQHVPHDLNAVSLRVTLRSLRKAALSPSRASETINFTEHRRRRVSLRRNPVQIGSASDVPTSIPKAWRHPFDAHRDNGGD